MPGGSWITGTIGYIAIIATWLNQIFVEQGIPKDGKGWTTLIIGNLAGLVGIFAKDYNKSNAPAPVAEAVTVPPKVG
jgi:hypothetical protein